MGMKTLIVLWLFCSCKWDWRPVPRGWAKCQPEISVPTATAGQFNLRNKNSLRSWVWGCNNSWVHPPSVNQIMTWHWLLAHKPIINLYHTRGWWNPENRLSYVYCIPMYTPLPSYIRGVNHQVHPSTKPRPLRQLVSGQPSGSETAGSISLNLSSLLLVMAFCFSSGRLAEWISWENIWEMSNTVISGCSDFWGAPKWNCNWSKHSTRWM